VSVAFRAAIDFSKGMEAQCAVSKVVYVRVIEGGCYCRVNIMAKARVAFVTESTEPPRTCPPTTSRRSAPDAEQEDSTPTNALPGERERMMDSEHDDQNGPCRKRASGTRCKRVIGLVCYFATRLLIEWLMRG